MITDYWSVTIGHSEDDPHQHEDGADPYQWQVARVDNGAPAQHPWSSHTGSNTTKVGHYYLWKAAKSALCFLTVSLQKYQYWAVLPSIVALQELSYLKSSKKNKKLVKLLQNILIAIEFTQTIWVLPKAESSQDEKD